MTSFSPSLAGSIPPILGILQLNGRECKDIGNVVGGRSRAGNSTNQTTNRSVLSGTSNSLPSYSAFKPKALPQDCRRVFTAAMLCLNHSSSKNLSIFFVKFFLYYFLLCFQECGWFISVIYTENYSKRYRFRFNTVLKVSNRHCCLMDSFHTSEY